MKKLMAIFLVMIMALSAAPLVFAEDANQDAGETPVEQAPVEEAVEETVEETIEEVVEEETPVEEVVEETPVEETTVETTEEETASEEAPVGETVEETTEEVVAEELPAEVIEEAGVTPDSFLWALERAIEKVDLLLTFDEATQATKELELAKERLAEVQVMVSESNLEDAADAQEAHDELLADVEETVAGMNGGDEEQLIAEATLEAQVNLHKTNVLKVEKAMLKTKGLTAEQQTQAKALFTSMAESADGAKLSIRVKKNKTQIKLKASKGMTDAEISALEEQARAIGGEGVDFKITGHKSKTKKGKPVAEVGDAEEAGEDSAVTVEKGGKGKEKAPKAKAKKK